MRQVLIVSENVLVRQGMKDMLSQEFRDLAIVEATDVSNVVLRPVKRAWDLIVVDVGFRYDGAFAAIREFRRSRTATRVLVLDLTANDRNVLRAARSGAAGYIPMNIGRADFIRAVARLLDGKTFFEGSPAAEAQAQEPRHVRLSARERVVMHAFAAGKRNCRIAAELNLSVKTVSTYRRRVLDKLELQSTADIVRYVVENGVSLSE
jgi:two-component system invasion response regulator UvrY